MRPRLTVPLVSLLALLPSPASAQAATDDHPLLSMPYTPSLDVPSMDKSADPCVDFYQYSCGGWKKNNPIPPDQTHWTVYGKLDDETTRYLWGILETVAKPAASRTPSEQKIGDFFASCTDEKAVDALGIAPLRPTLDEIGRLKLDALPAWLGRTQLSLGADGDLLFGFDSQQDYGNAAAEIAFANAGGLGLPDRDYYTKSDPKSVEIRARYVAHVAATLVLAGEKPALAQKHAAAILAFETKLAAASLTRVERREPANLHHKLDRQALQALTPSFAWDRFLAAAGVPSIDAVNVSEPKFFATLDAVLRALPIDTLHAYLRWHVVRSASPYLSKPFVDENFAFYRKYLRGAEINRPRWKRCVNLVDRNLGEALGKVYVDKMFSSTMKERTLQMTQAIEHEMEAHLKELPWMSAATKEKALEKLHTIANKVGYPDHWRDYSALDIRRGDFFGNVVRAVAFESRRQLAKIGRPLDRGEWGMTPPSVNAYYDPQMNDINFPAGVLQPPLFDFKLDDAPNYGNTGSTIGHELTHGFDDEGRKFDARGNLADWWTAADAAEFGRRAQCVVDEYAQFKVVDDIKINSKLTLGEDVADLGGTQLAYDAWKRANAGRTLPSGDGFSPDQRFFIGMAQWACDNERDENKRVNAVVDPHSPDEYRINGVVANMPAFGKAFACKVGQPMVRKNVCRIW